MRKGGACQSAFTRRLSEFCLTLLGQRPYLLQERHDIKIVAYFFDLASFDSVHEGREEVFHTLASGRESAPGVRMSPRKVPSQTISASAWFPLTKMFWMVPLTSGKVCL